MTTKHTCGGPVFGKKTPGCPRCDEMIHAALEAQRPPTDSEILDWALAQGGFARANRQNFWLNDRSEIIAAMQAEKGKP